GGYCGAGAPVSIATRDPVSGRNRKPECGVWWGVRTPCRGRQKPARQTLDPWGSMGTATVRQVGRGGLLASMALALACGHSPHVDIRQLDSSIRRELPTGTPKSAVVAFLDGHAVHHSESPDKRTVFGL